MSKAKDLVVFQGGPLDGQTGTVASHDELVIPFDDGAYYARQDQQQGDHRVYRYTLGEGEPFPVSSVDPGEPHNTLQHDMAVLEREREDAE